QNCAVFIDALDELPKIESKEKALTEIGKFHTKYPKIKIVCSSRPSDYLFHNCETQGYRYLEIEDLNIAQITQYLNTYFGENIIKSKSLLKSLKDSEILDKLPKTPLSIALITILFDEKEVEIPATITDLYEDFVNLLIGKTSIKQTTDIIEKGIKHRILCYIAKSLHSDLKNSILKDDLYKLVTDYATDRGQPFDVNQVLNEIMDKVGLLYLNDKDEVKFKHQSFQEYFTAFELFHHRQSDRKLFVENFNDLWWQNVAIFYAGMSKDSPKLIGEILKKSKPEAFHDYISNTAGIGRLLQALYNTPIPQRKEGIKRGLENTTSVIKFLIEEDEEYIDFFKNFSKYGLMQIFGGWFKHNFWSITLKEPISSLFNEIFQDFNETDMDKSDLFKFQYHLYLLSSILASDSFLEIEQFKMLIDQTTFLDIDVLAICDTHYKKLLKTLPHEYRNNEHIKKIKRKLEIKKKSFINMEDKVNTTVSKLRLKNT
ncbi:NACHT domain-containing protein, partial [Candidatus Cloacimonadota bacterium]